MSKVRTLRDDFAITAMQSLLIHPQLQRTSNEDVTREAYLVADAMIEARDGDGDEDTSTLEEAKQYFHEVEKAKADDSDFFRRS